MKASGITLLVLLGILSFPLLWVGAHACGWVGEAATVAREEFGPRALLQKYEEFKNLHASLSSKKASIDVLDAGIAQFQKDYDGVPKKDWPRDERQQFSQDRKAVEGLKLVFNIGAAQYNAAMTKFNYAFCNAGTLPQGASEPLPREYVTYLVN